MLGAKRKEDGSRRRPVAGLREATSTGPTRIKDGRHTRAEYVERWRLYDAPGAGRASFGATDNNADGIATRTEYVLNRVITDEAKGIVQRTDADQDGRVTRVEFVEGSPIKDKAMSRAVFDALDTSGDGVITIPEYLRVWGGWARPNYKAQEATLAARLAKLSQDSDSRHRLANASRVADPPAGRRASSICSRSWTTTRTVS